MSESTNVPSLSSLSVSISLDDSVQIWFLATIMAATRCTDTLKDVVIPARSHIR